MSPLDQLAAAIEALEVDGNVDPVAFDSLLDRLWAKQLDLDPDSARDYVASRAERDRLLSELFERGGARATIATSSSNQQLGSSAGNSPRVPFGIGYRRADESVEIATRDPLTVDPALLERGTRGHARAQNLIAEAVTRSGFRALSPAPGEPNYDLCWETATQLWVVEVKSLTDDNQERQLRFGLGQILRYRSILQTQGIVVRAVLMTERRPQDEGWHALFNELGVVLAWSALIEESDGRLPDSMRELAVQ